MRRADHRDVDRHLRAVPVHPADQARPLRPDLRGAHLSAQAERTWSDDPGVGQDDAGAPGALTDPRRDVFGHRRYHALRAYLALSEPRGAREYPQNRHRNRRLATSWRTGSSAHDAQRHLPSDAILPYSLG